MATGGGVEFKISSTAADTVKVLNELKQNLNSTGVSIQKLNLTIKDNSKQINNVKNSTKNLNIEASNAYKTFNSLGKVIRTAFNIGNLIYYWNITTKLRNSIINMTKAAMDYQETQNLFEVSMRKNTQRAYEFRDALVEAFGLARTEIMETQASFNNMLTSLGGISSDMAYTLSESLMLMSIDYSSLFNVSLTKTYEKFKSAISGMVKFCLVWLGNRTKSSLIHGNPKRVMT